MVGPAPTAGKRALDPVNEWGHDHLWWLDRMVRSQRPLQERMTLFWHDHFATRDQDTPLMLAQNRVLLERDLGRVSEALAAFQADLEARGVGDRVLTLVWTEFGRRPQEHSSGGTTTARAGWPG
jgi:hypothetical protein